MITSDFHIHSTFSDGRDRVAAICAHAVEIGVTELCFTEHIDFDVNDPDFGRYNDAAFSKSVAKARLAFAGTLSIAKGCEFDFSTTYGADYAAFLDPLEFDFILGSVHNIFGYHIGRRELLERTPRELQEEYLRQIRALAGSGLCHVLAHFDYLQRLYCTDWQTDPRDEWYWARVDDILRLCVGEGIGIEVNTQGAIPGLVEPAAQSEILRRYHALGGRIVTVGSDAHHAGQLQQGFDVAEDILKGAGFAEIAVFKEGRPVFRSL
ncbi:MAG: histidinol-phosphatase HisJ family protein [Phycisphaerae bacterium]|nr:histidinol-phosphatase HisJ family protein [Phycisphaerae bacterium]